MPEIGHLPKFEHIPLPGWQDGTLRHAEIEARFAPDYRSARERFLLLAEAAGAHRFSYPIGGLGAAGEPLSIDIAELCNAPSISRAQGVLVLISGVHGSEGRPGSAIQQQLLAHPEIVPPECAVILVHALNPYGMSHERRNTANNVDLNRNYTSDHSGAPEGYERLRHLFTGKTPRELEQSLNQIDSLGEIELRRILQTVAIGQYEYPRDPFFGGAAIEPNIEILRQHLKSRLGGNQSLLVLDIHTGLGQGGEDTLFFIGDNAEMKDRLSRALEPRHLLRDPRLTIPYFERVRGNVAGELARDSAGRDGSGCVLEIGTYPRMLLSTQVLEAYCAQVPESGLRETSRDLSREFFCPDDMQWRDGVLRRGEDIVQRSLRALRR